jgi:hypothetical protein
MIVNDVKGAVYEALKEYKIMQIFDAWEKHQDEWKLIYSIYGLTGSEGFLIHTRIIFLFDSKKKELKENAYLILVDLDCNYKAITIGSDLKINIKSNIDSLIKSKGQIKELGDFLMNGTDEFNKIFKQNNTDQTIIDLKYVPQEEKCTCFNQKFDFILTDRVKQWYFQIERKAGKAFWRFDINEKQSFDVLLLEDAYKEILNNIYGTN